MMLFYDFSTAVYCDGVLLDVAVLDLLNVWLIACHYYVFYVEREATFNGLTNGFIVSDVIANSNH